MNLRKTFFILPNLFTLSSLFCGFFAIVTVASGGATSVAALYQACVAIAFGVFFDMADGRVARLTKTQSSLGLQLDSLSDLVTFGVAPALLIYRWGLDRLVSELPHVGRHLGLFVVFCFLAAAALRLARFNVLAMAEAEDKKKPGKYIIGLPVPVAASVLVSIVALNYQLHGSFVEAGQVALTVVVLVLSYLMVSRVRFRSFKDLRMSRRTLTVASALVGGIFLAVFWKRVPSGFIFVSLLGTYLALGLMEEVVFYRRRRAEDRAAAATPMRGLGSAAVLEADGGARSDEEVLAELGAFDEDREASNPSGRPLDAAAFATGRARS